MRLLLEITGQRKKTHHLSVSLCDLSGLTVDTAQKATLE